MIRASADSLVIWLLIWLLLLTTACRGDQTGRDIESLRTAGHDLFFARAGCAACHTVGDEGDKVRGPNLAAVGKASRRPDLSPIEYGVESIVDPDAYVVPGYPSGVMPRQDEPPVALSNDEIVALAAWLAGKGTQVRVTLPDLQAARARIFVARRERTRRRTEARVADLLGRVRWDGADAARGADLYRELGCAGCHDAGKGSLAGIGGRLDRAEIARRIAGFSRSRMPSYCDALGADELASLSLFLAGR